jgi:hypothetical protein
MAAHVLVKEQTPSLVPVHDGGMARLRGAVAPVLQKHFGAGQDGAYSKNPHRGYIKTGIPSPMKSAKRMSKPESGLLAAGLAAAASAAILFGQQPPAPVTPAPTAIAGGFPQPMNWTSSEDHRNMMDQLGIKALRPGPSGNESAPNHANYNGAKANPFPNLPDALTLKNGKRVTTAREWWDQRRPEIVEDFEREVLGRVPKGVPAVTWTVADRVEGTIGAYPVIAKQLVGHVDNALYPPINVDIQLTLVIRAHATGPVNLHGASMTADTRTVQTGSTFFPGRTSFSSPQRRPLRRRGESSGRTHALTNPIQVYIA